MSTQIQRTYIARRRAQQRWLRESYSILASHARMDCRRAVNAGEPAGLHFVRGDGGGYREIQCGKTETRERPVPDLQQRQQHRKSWNPSTEDMRLSLAAEVLLR